MTVAAEPLPSTFAIATGRSVVAQLRSAAGGTDKVFRRAWCAHQGSSGNWTL